LSRQIGRALGGDLWLASPGNAELRLCGAEFIARLADAGHTVIETTSFVHPTWVPQLADAEAQARWAVEHATGIWAIDALAHLVETLTERGALDDAAAELRRMAPPLTSHTVVVAAYLMARGQLRIAQGRGEEGLGDFLACGERCERLGIIDGLYAWRSEAAIAHALLDNAVGQLDGGVEMIRILELGPVEQHLRPLL